MKTLRTIYPYGLSERAMNRNNDDQLAITTRKKILNFNSLVNLVFVHEEFSFIC